MYAAFAARSNFWWTVEELTQGFDAKKIPLADALKLMADYQISGIPVVEPAANGGREGRLVGIVTNRDVRFATNPKQRVAELETQIRLLAERLELEATRKP